MTSFSAKNNLLTGRIPYNFAQLTRLSLENNRLTGPLPRKLKADFMQDFRLSNNQLTGTLEFDGLMGHLSSSLKLTHLYLDHNKFKGTLPKSLSLMTDLKMMHLQNNQFTGQIPNLKALTKLVDAKGTKLAEEDGVNFAGNTFACPIPSTSVVYDTANCVCQAGWQCIPV